MKIKILRSASKDLVAAYRFYEDQSPRVGEYFLDSLFSDIDSLVLNGGIHPLYFNHYRRILSRRFPYAVFYRVDSNTVVVCAVLDCRRNPDWIKKRLS